MSSTSEESLQTNDKKSCKYKKTRFKLIAHADADDKMVSEESDTSRLM